MHPFVQDFLKFQSVSPTAWHATASLSGILTGAGFGRLNEQDAWSLEPGGRYFVCRGGSSLIAFALPSGAPRSVSITASHSDSPAFRLQHLGSQLRDAHYTRLNVEKYGGSIFSSWFDRPLSVAGRLFFREGDGVSVRLIKSSRDLCVIPNVAIHMNREVNSGYAYKPQVDLMPLWGSADAPSLLETLAEEAGIAPETVVSTDLQLYNRMPGLVWGVEESYVSAGRLDDLECAYASIRALVSVQPAAHLAMACVFDNEEVGSGSMQGADSSFLSDVLDRIAEGLALSAEGKRRMLASAFMVSADNAHATHPNHPEYANATEQAWMNGGIVIKHNASLKYTTDGQSEGIFSELCRRAGVPVQHYANRPDMAGGSTLGHISQSHISVTSVDVGLAQLAMHSAWETAGARDLPMLADALQTCLSTCVIQRPDGGFDLL